MTYFKNEMCLPSGLHPPASVATNVVLTDQEQLFLIGQTSYATLHFFRPGGRNGSDFQNTVTYHTYLEQSPEPSTHKCNILSS